MDIYLHVTELQLISAAVNDTNCTIVYKSFSHTNGYLTLC